MSDFVIGIDLGTTNSCVAMYKDKHVEILENSDGGRTTPSFIYFTETDIVVGQHAKRMSKDLNADCGIYEVKRLVGRKFTDHYLQQNLNYLPFRVEGDASDEPIVIINRENIKVRKTPEELCTIILQKLKKDVEAKIGKVVNKVVITVPAYFNVRQREVTLKAAQEAEFTVLKLLNEPTAAALTYYFDHKGDKKSYSLVFDLGGGTFDVAVLKKSTRDIEIVGVDGDTQLGGHDFDNLIMEYICELLKRDYGYDLKSDKDNVRRLHSSCEAAKIELSTVQETQITLMGVVKHQQIIRIKFTRKQFEDMCDPLFKQAIVIVDSCLKSCGIAKHLIKDVILSGGSTRIPKIQEMISEYFNGKNLNKFVNPDECVAKGAALQAAMLSKKFRRIIPSISLKDVVPLSLGVEIFAGEMSFLIKRNTVIPTNASKNFFTVENNQPEMHFSIYEGERKEAKKNRLIGHLDISDITLAPPGKCRVTLSMKVDINGILTVTATERVKNNVKELRASYARGDKSESEIKDFSADSKNQEEDRRFQNFVKYKKYLINYCARVMYNFERKRLESTHSEIYDLCKDFKEIGETKDLDEKTVKQLIDEVKLQCEPFVRYYKFQNMPKLK